MDWFGGFGLPISLTPFACNFPSIPGFYFDFLAITIAPPFIVVALVFFAKCLNARAVRLQAEGDMLPLSRVLADVCDTAWVRNW